MFPVLSITLIPSIAISLLLMTTSTNNQNNDNKRIMTTTTLEETYQRLVDKLRPKLRLTEDTTGTTTPSQYWVGIAGGPGSGKTTVAQAVADRLNAICPDSTIVIPMDGWHFYQSDLIAKYGPEAMKRRGAPWTFDVTLCRQQLQEAKQLQASNSLPRYSRDISDPQPDAIQLLPSHQVVLVEGMYLLGIPSSISDPQKKNQPDEWARLSELWDERWFVKCPSRQDQIDRLVQRSLATWSEAKASLWGAGQFGAQRRVEENDVPNMDLVADCGDVADEIIVNA